MRQSVYNQFVELQQKNHSSIEGYYIAAPLSFNEQYKIGISGEGCPIFFIPSTTTTFAVDINMEMITVLFGRICKIHDSRNTEGIHTIITLKTVDHDIQKYFIDIISLILEQLPPTYSDAILVKEIQKLINLFSQLSLPPKKTIQGLWAELLVIERANNPEYLIKSWHIDTHDKYDFNDGLDKLEVKSSIRQRRIHHFSIEQLTANNNSNLIIASVKTVPVGQGVNIFTLRDNICAKIKDLQTQYFLNEIIIKTIGTDFSKVADMFFDYKQAIDNLKYYDAHTIPTIDIAYIPKDVSNIHFDSDLSNVNPLQQSQIACYHSQLYNSLTI